MHRTFSRRRAIGIMATAVGLEFLPVGRVVRAGDIASWRGTVLGAPAHLRIHHFDRSAAERLVALSVHEAQRLERVFSLYRPDSALVELNRRGVLEAPPADLVDLLTESRRYHELSGGAFDPTVQPLWSLYVDHFSRLGAAVTGPPMEAVAGALEKVGFDKMRVSRDCLAFGRRGMAITLNGIAQGFITDRIVALLRHHGIEHSAVDMGEQRVIGTRPDGTPWRVALADSDEVLAVSDRAVATSAGGGFRFDAEGRFNHLFDPRTGRSADARRSVTVIAPTATAADALSTALNLLPQDRGERLMAGLPDAQAHFAAGGNGGKEVPSRSLRID